MEQGSYLVENRRRHSTPSMCVVTAPLALAPAIPPTATPLRRSRNILYPPAAAAPAVATAPQLMPNVSRRNASFTNVS